MKIANSIQQKGSAPVDQERSKGIRLARMIFAFLAGLFTLCLIIQLFIAGLAIFVDSVFWPRHTLFAHIFDKIPLLMLLLSFLGRFPVQIRWYSAALSGLVFVMYFTANIRPILPWVAATHPVVAVGMIGLALLVMMKISPMLIGRKSKI